MFELSRYIPMESVTFELTNV